MPRGRPRKTQGNVMMKSAEMIGWAIGGLEREIVATKERLAALTAQANTLKANMPAAAARARGYVQAEAGEAVAATERVVRKRRKMSREARKKISDMMKKRWAERRKAAK
jgi:uncharacterized membrane protein